ncbi:MAG: OmpA family protein [Pseudomonadales bacterium]
MDVRFSPFEIFTTTGALFLCLVFVCVFSEASDIEDQLGAQVSTKVAKEDLFWASVEPQGQRIVLTGAAPDHRAKVAAGELASSVYGVSNVRNEIAIIGEAGTCQSEFDRYLKDERVTFKSGRADISDGSLALLGMLASVIRNCDVRVEVAAHTDAEGDSAINHKLSERRAQAVAKYLVGSGVPVDYIVANGYGETQPVADNTTADGRQSNRRVEFRVIGNAS